MVVEVFELQDQDSLAWDEFVYTSPNGTFFHLSGWKDVMEDTFGLECLYLYAKEGDQIIGILPLLHVNKSLSGHYVTSMPDALCTLNGVATRSLLERAIEIVNDKNAKYLLLRDSNRKWDIPELVTNEDHCAFTVKLCDDSEKMWKKIDRRVRQHANKAIKAGVEVKLGPQYLDSLYPVYSRAMQEKGTPTLGYAFFHNALREFPNHFTIIMVCKDSEVLGGWFAAFFRDTIYITWAGLLSQYYKQYFSTHSIYWETLKYGCENGFQWVDLGRSKVDSGGYVFKTRWGAEPRPIYQQSYLNGISQPPVVGGSREDDPKYRLFVNIWRRLPVSVVEYVGPQLRKRMPFG